ncbi:MAG: ATPase, T2SS/T4P/T4SS family [Candidatus Omnitrophota bacterium]|nr:Flp pilus assembly complex ATPase component TadA [Candidatus Omnitrophota bacterium]
MAEMRLGELLVNKKLITSSQLNEALKQHHETGEFLGEILVRKGFASEEQVAQSLSEQLGFAYVDLENYNLEPQIIKSLPFDLAVKYQVLPLFKRGDVLTVAMFNPLDLGTIDEIQKLINQRIRPVFAVPSRISKRIEEEYRKTEFMPILSEIEDIEITGLDSARVASLAPVVSIVDNLISTAVEMRASDIHLEPQGPHFYCRLRIDGILHDMPRLPKKYEAAIISRIKIMASMDIAEKRLPQDGRIQTHIDGKNVDLRISTFPTMYGENLVIRILDKTRLLFCLEDLGLSDGDLPVFEQIIHKPHGIILVTGPTGSGKSTTLYAALNKINAVEKNVITMEDPIEYEIKRARQSQVNVKAGLTFASGLRSIVRQDPDVIMIGEIRDRETAEIAIHAALTGHLVFSTLHTNDAASGITRLVDMGIEPFLVSSSVICIVAQRLVRVLCAQCKEQYKPDKEVLDELKIEKKASYKFYRQTGCRQCRDTGYSGRVGIFEILIPDDGVKKLIDKKGSSREIREYIVSEGATLLRQDGMDKLIKGITSLSEIFRVTQEI